MPLFNFNKDKFVEAVNSEDSEFNVRKLVTESVPAEHQGPVATALLEGNFESNGKVTVTLPDVEK